MSYDTKTDVFSGTADIGEDLYNPGSSTERSGGLKRAVNKPAQKLGFHKSPHDDRLFKTYNRVDALSKKPVDWDVSRDDRMSPDAAGDMMMSLVELVGLLGSDAATLEAFHSAVFFSHSVNGGSVLQPGRAELTVKGAKFAYKDLVSFLGQDVRRFFRAYADYIRENNQRILANSDPNDVEGQERRHALPQVAADRGLTRFPHLCHDSADACTMLVDAERAALVASKAAIFSAGENMADRNRARPGGSSSTAAGSMFVTPNSLVS